MDHETREGLEAVAREARVETAGLRRELNEVLGRLHDECLTPLKISMAILVDKLGSGEVMTRAACLEMHEERKRRDTDLELLQEDREKHAVARAEDARTREVRQVKRDAPRKRRPMDVVAGIGAIVIGIIVGTTGLVTIVKTLVLAFENFGKAGKP